MIKYGRFISSGWIDETLIIRVSFQHSHGICSSHLKKFHDIDIYNLKIHTSSQKKIKKKKKKQMEPTNGFLTIVYPVHFFC